jgi:cell division protein FtsB
VDPVITREDTRPGGVRRTAGLTTRAIALAVVLLILTISYASSLRVYINQHRDIADTQQQIIESQQRIGQLSDEITRWNDPNYVKTQARTRLGWVMPGETGYRVIGPDGKPITGDTEIAATGSTPKPARKPWYDTVWGSVEAADDPHPVTKPSADDEPPITEHTKPSSRPSASPTR